MDSCSDAISSAFFFREKTDKKCKEEFVVRIGKESSRRDHATGIRTVVEVGCFLMDATLVLVGHLTGFWVRQGKGGDWWKAGGGRIGMRIRWEDED